MFLFLVSLGWREVWVWRIKVWMCGRVGVYIIYCEPKSSLPVEFWGLIKDPVLLSFSLSLPLSVCPSVRLVDWQPCNVSLLLYVLFSSSTTQWSVSVPKLRCSPFLNHCRPASCILHGTLPSIMRSSSGLGTSCQSERTHTHTHTRTYETGSVCVCLSALKREAPLGPLPQQQKSNGVCVCVWGWCLLSFEYRGRKHRGWQLEVR